MAETLTVQCCVVGGGPAGMMLGYLLGRAGVKTLVLEKHKDFLRDFRGDTVHPSTLDIMSELGLIEDFLTQPHSEVREIAAEVEDKAFKVADFRHIPGPNKFMGFMPQWDFLNFLMDKGKAFPRLQVMMEAEGVGLIEEDGRVVGVQVKANDGEREVRAHLVMGCDGRASLVRAKAGLKVEDLGAPIDVLWFRLPKHKDDPAVVLGRLRRDSMIVTLDRDDYWQCAYIIAKGGAEGLKAEGLEAFRSRVAKAAPFLDDRTDELKSLDDVKLLSVSVDRLAEWSRPGLLCIGDAAHAMSPVGGVGINLAIQDAVATANQLAAKLKAETVTDADLDAVRRRRLLAVKVIQAMQVAVHENVLKPAVTGGAGPLKPPMALKLLNASAWLRRWPAELIGLGVRREHVRSPAA